MRGIIGRRTNPKFTRDTHLRFVERFAHAERIETILRTAQVQRDPTLPREDA